MRRRFHPFRVFILALSLLILCLTALWPDPAAPQDNVPSRTGEMAKDRVLVADILI